MYQKIFFILLLTASHLLAQSPLQLSLNGKWEYAQTHIQYWKPCQIPNSIYTILQEDKAIPDPFYGVNEHSVQWVGEENWSFRREFYIEQNYLDFQEIDLMLEGLDTYADIYINDFLIGKGKNAFICQTYTVKSFLVAGKNKLRIDLYSAKRISDSLYNVLPVSLPGESRVCTRKPQYQYGWDFGPKLIGCGLTGNCSLNAWNKTIIRHHSVHTQSIQQDKAHLQLRLELENHTEEIITAEFVMGNHIFAFNILQTPGFQDFIFNFQLDSIQLWWPNGMGQQHLYQCTLRLLDTNQVIVTDKTWSAGIRTINLKHDPDSIGQSFYFVVNDRKIFAKGANYIPQHMYPAPHASYGKIIEDAAACHFNMLRVWGGGQYETDLFYEKCDSLGILIWQDFMYACGMYPGDTLFYENAKNEAEYQVKRLAKYACVALWCGNNESNEGWHRWGWQFLLSSHSKERIWADYQKLFLGLLPDAVKQFSNNQSYWESSPLFGRGDDRFVTEGDAHDWGVWHDEMPFEKLEERVPRFMSEFGFQSLPPLCTIKTFADSNSLSLDSDALLSHQKHPRGNKIIKQYLNWDFPKPKSFASLVYLNQLNQSEGISKGLIAHRLGKPYCMGTLYWQYNDCWPGISWSSRDFYGHWKALQHKTKEVFNPILVQGKYKNDLVEIWINSDLLENQQVTIECLLVDMAGQSFPLDSFTVLAEMQECKKVYEFYPSKSIEEFREEEYVLLIKWKTNIGEFENILLFTKPKKLLLQKPEFEIQNVIKTENGFEFELKTNQLVRFIYISEELGESIRPNFFDAYPGKKMKIQYFTPQDTFRLNLGSFLSLNDCIEPE